MRSSSRHLFHALLFTLILPAGCFTPDYGEGSFLCAEGLCPDGYGCVCSAGKSRCQKGAASRPCDATDSGGPREGGGGPREGGGSDAWPMGPVICSPSKQVTDALMIGTGTFDLTLDKAGNPILVWVSNKGELFASNPDLKATAWPLTGILHKTARTQTVAAAVNADDQLHVIFPDKEKTTSGTTLWHDYIKLKGAPFGWSGASEIFKMDTVEVSLAGSPTLSSSLYLAATEKVPVTGGARRLVARLAPRTGGYGLTPVCNTATTTTYRAPRVAMGTLNGGVANIAISFHESRTPTWELATLKVGDTNCPTWYPLAAAKKDSPAALVLDGLGGFQVAFSPAGTSLRGMGKLKWLISGPSTAINPSSIKTVMDNEIVAPRSVSLAMRNNAPCIAAWEYMAQPLKTDLRVSCNDSPQSWRPSTIIDTHKLTPTQYQGYETRMIGDSSGKLHLAYMVQTGTSTVSLYYVTCK